MTTLEIEKMSISERIQAMEILWNSLMSSSNEIDSPKWHYDVLNQRIKKVKNGEAEFISLDDLASRRK